MTTKNYDIIIVGSGIAGLYSAYQIKKQSPKTSFVILEKYKKQWVGGRVNNFEFYGTQLVTGAGVGRGDTNPLLIQMLKEFHIPYEKQVSLMDFAKTIPKPVNVMKIIELLRKEYKKNSQQYKLFTFQEFSQKILGPELYRDFIVSSGYTDYENADVYETLYNYGMDDTKGGWSILYISWKKLIDKLCDFIGTENIKASFILFEFCENLV
jgi:UDP-galactopyranose mutase